MVRCSRSSTSSFRLTVSASVPSASLSSRRPNRSRANTGRSSGRMPHDRLDRADNDSSARFPLPKNSNWSGYRDSRFAPWVAARDPSRQLRCLDPRASSSRIPYKIRSDCLLPPWSGYRDSNPGPHRPERCALPTALYPAHGGTIVLFL